MEDKNNCTWFKIDDGET